MKTSTYLLPNASLGLAYQLTAFHFGEASATQKIYLQASLHADELPGSLVCYHLAQLLEAHASAIKAQIILVPLCNPIGLAQQNLYTPQGRFELGTGQNFNRLGDLNLYELTRAVLQQNHGTLAASLQQNTAANLLTIRSAMAQGLATFQPKNQLQTLHKQLLLLAYDADIVLDLHCDWRAIMHVYTLPETWPTIEPLARYLGSKCQLLADDSGCNPFDEALSTVWTRLAADFPNAAIPAACAAVTVELRGQADVNHEYAEQDARAILDYLKYQGAIKLATAPLPDLLDTPRPLAGVERIVAPESGMVVYHVQPSAQIEKGHCVADIVNPITMKITPIFNTISGVVYACNHLRYAKIGEALISLAGSEAIHEKATLSA
ncbi:MAG: succinylglutamate desuccinylase/aspartoacylase family protein [Neisseriaceae bacterium]|nr:succinylglutamate desuccinylase/aspartoacylase family protein [Neisseriaceae bacterium]